MVTEMTGRDFKKGDIVLIGAFVRGETSSSLLEESVLSPIPKQYLSILTRSGSWPHSSAIMYAPNAGYGRVLANRYLVRTSLRDRVECMVTGWTVIQTGTTHGSGHDGANYLSIDRTFKVFAVQPMYSSRRLHEILCLPEDMEYVQ